MIRSLTGILIVALLLGGIAYTAIYFWRKQRIDAHREHLTAFQWFCQEFEVDEAQREKMEALHTAYFPECEDHCVHYADTRQTLAEITRDPDLNNSPEHEHAARRLADLEKEADKRFIDFVYEIATEMEPGHSERYLRRMKGWLNPREPVNGD